MENSEHHPAFPIQLNHPNGEMEGWHGLTKREYFAAMAMQGILASIDDAEGLNEVGKKAVVKTAIELTDELLNQLNLTTP